MTDKTTEEYFKLKHEHAIMFGALESIRATCFGAVLADETDELVNIIESIRLEATKKINEVKEKER